MLLQGKYLHFQNEKSIAIPPISMVQTLEMGRYAFTGTLGSIFYHVTVEL